MIIKLLFMMPPNYIHEKIKHIEIVCHFVLVKIYTAGVCLNHILTHSQVADLFTKSLFEV